MPETRDSAQVPDAVSAERVASGTLSGRSSVSDLVRSDGAPSDEQQASKRDRSESGDPVAPSGKHNARDVDGAPSRSPSLEQSTRSLKKHLDGAVEKLEDRITSAISRELHEFRLSFREEFEALNNRMKDLEQHVEERDGVIDTLNRELGQSRSEVEALQNRVEEAELISRLPCLILSGKAMAPRKAPLLAAPLPAQREPPGAAASRPAPGGEGQFGRPQALALDGAEREVTSQSAGDLGAGPGARAAGPGRDGSDRRGVAGPGQRMVAEREDINTLVVTTLNSRMPGMNMTEQDIDRAHRLPGPNNRVIVKFVRTGQGSVRDAVMWRRLELRGNDLFVGENLSKLRGAIFRGLLAAKKEEKIYTVYTRGGQVYYKDKKGGTSTRVDSLLKLRQLGFTVVDRDRM